ncbi:MAG: cytochrome c biogenesis protein CcdA, partial [Patescibacteria group bacterium]
MTFLLISFIAGILTVLAPCVLPLLPVIIGSSVSDVRSKLKPYVITASLTVSVILFTLILKVATVFINIPPTFWQYLSGGILIIFGLITLFPSRWEKISIKLNLALSRKSNRVLAQGVKKESFWGDIIIGASLGPVFSSCSPTYFVILATVLPQSFAKGLVDLIAYSIGLSLSLLLISKLGQKLVGRLEGVSNPEGWFKKTLGVIFLLVGIFVATGYDKVVQSYLIENSNFDVTKIEENYLLPNATNNTQGLGGPTLGNSLATEDVANGSSTTNMESGSNQISKPDTLTLMQKKLAYPMYKELVNPSGFVNSDPFELKDIVGKKVILLDVMTYSCINCQRTFPYANAWYEKYKDKGLEIIAIHTPEFAFEHNIDNVREAMAKFGIKFPVVLDNDYGTWNAYGNNYWPRKYLIDIDGYVVYDHIGEGGYDETEAQIKKALEERAERLGNTNDVKQISTTDVSAGIVPAKPDAKSQETYFGAFRNDDFFGNGNGGLMYTDTFTLPKTFEPNQFYLGGNWTVNDQYIESNGDATLAFSYDATKVHLVAEAPDGATIKIQNGDASNTKTMNIKDATLYTIVDNPSSQKSVFYLSVPKGVRLYS